MKDSVIHTHAHTHIHAYCNMTAYSFLFYCYLLALNTDKNNKHKIKENLITHINFQYLKINLLWKTNEYLVCFLMY